MRVVSSLDRRWVYSCCGAHAESPPLNSPSSPRVALLSSVLTMANVADTKLYDILGVSPSASENELKKVKPGRLFWIRDLGGRSTPLCFNWE